MLSPLSLPLSTIFWHNKNIPESICEVTRQNEFVCLSRLKDGLDDYINV